MSLPRRPILDCEAMPSAAPEHPGVVLREEFMEPLGVSQNALARALHVDPRRINDLVHGRRSITGDTALRLAVFFETTAEFWMHLQVTYDLRVALLAFEEHPRDVIEACAVAA